MNNKIISLELLRFISSLMVVIWHYQNFFFPYNTISSFDIFNNNNEIIKLFLNSKLGTHGVYIFFCISGIVFSLTYLKKKISSKDFVLKRFARLYPLHFLTLIVVALIQLINKNYIGEYQIYFINDLKHFFLNIFFISGWGFEDSFSFNGPIWSVSLELIVYFVFFILISALSKSNYLLTIIIVILIFTIRGFIFDNELFSALGLFFCGVLLFKLYSERRSLTLFVISILLFTFNFFGNYKIILTCIGICSFFLSINRFILNDYLNKIFSILGNLTYASYLLHIPIQLIFIFAVYKFNISQNFFNNFYFFTFFIFLVYSISYYIFKFYEKPASIFFKNKFKLDYK